LIKPDSIAAVSFHHVRKVYGDSVVAVDDVSFVIERGSLVTLLGPSGCGKTTTLRLIAGLEMVSSGQIRIAGKDVTKLPATDRDVSMVFQSYALFPHMTVGENVAYGLQVSGKSKAQVQQLSAEGLELVGLAGYAQRLPSELSGGQQQRVAVARALVLEPQVLLFDEPLSNLDAKLRRQVREEIRDIQQKLGLTVVYVTHDQEEALAVSDRIIVMKNAGIAQQGAPRDLYEQPADRFVADFIGDANIVEVQITALLQDMARVAIGGCCIELPHRGLAVGPVHAAIRPEAFNLSAQERPNAIAGQVLKSSYLGKHIEYTIDTELGPVFVVDGNVLQAYVKGTDVSLTLADHGVVLVPTSRRR